MTDAYTRNLWNVQSHLVEVWCESDSIAGVIAGTCNEYQVDYLPCRGQGGKGYIFQAAQHYRSAGSPVVCIYIGDFDPAGLDIGNSLQERLDRYGAPDVEFQRIAITPQQVAQMGLPGHGLSPKVTKPTLNRFLAVCDEHNIPHEAVESEAMPSPELRRLLAEAIHSYIDPRQWELEKTIQEQERQDLLDMLETVQ